MRDRADGNRTGQVWLARCDSNDEFVECVVVGRASYDQYGTFGWHAVTLDAQHYFFGILESQFAAVERGAKDIWVRARLA